MVETIGGNKSNYIMLYIYVSDVKKKNIFYALQPVLETNMD